MIIATNRQKPLEKLSTVVVTILISTIFPTQIAHLRLRSTLTQVYSFRLTPINLIRITRYFLHTTIL